jgi:DNA (cytosine-5)-methyltransferase 1
MIALDLFCGAGGASKGLKNAGFTEIFGIDIKYFEEYPFSLLVADALDNSSNLFAKADFIWASPPCQAYSFGTIGWRNKGKKYPDLVGKTRKLLLKTGKPFVIENVPGAPLRKDLLLCGEMFDLRVIRHRIFEIHGFKCEQPEHKKHKRAVWNGTAIPCWTGGRLGCFGNKKHRSYYASVAGHGGQSYSFTLENWQKAMGINWINNKKTLAQCVPPKYSEYIGKQFLNSKKAGGEVMKNV